ncbi:Catechol 1,2-dioxygenase [Paramyrothecium foliicola]|nr:Catechol 1,2-dioxygenase [Paramyrothecium foliicola]
MRVTDEKKSGQAAPPFAYGTDLAAAVIEATGPGANPRLREVMPALVRHLHGFASEVNLTMDEWFAGVELINQCGKISSETRNETQLLCDVLGFETLVDAITSKLARSLEPEASASSATALPPTPSNVLGPFYRSGAPILPAEASIISAENRAAWPSAVTFFHDIWHAAPSGMYEQQDESQPDMDLRGRFSTAADGTFSLYCLRPASYPIPADGPIGQLLAGLDRHPYRPAQIHVIVSAPGDFRTLATQLYDSEDPWLYQDAVFAVKPELVVKFVPSSREQDDSRWEVAFDFVLAKERLGEIQRHDPPDVQD